MDFNSLNLSQAGGAADSRCSFSVRTSRSHRRGPQGWAPPDVQAQGREVGGHPRGPDPSFALSGCVTWGQVPDLLWASVCSSVKWGQGLGLAPRTRGHRSGLPQESRPKSWCAEKAPPPRGSDALLCGAWVTLLMLLCSPWPGPVGREKGGAGLGPASKGREAGRADWPTPSSRWPGTKQGLTGQEILDEGQNSIHSQQPHPL